MAYKVKLGETHRFKAEPKNEDGSHHDYVHAPTWGLNPADSPIGPLFGQEFDGHLAYSRFRGDAVGAAKVQAVADGIVGSIDVEVVAPFASIEITGELLPS